MDPVQVGLVTLWSLVGAGALRNARRLRAPHWYASAVTAGVLVTIAGLCWHVQVLRFGQEALRSADLYEHREWIKLVIAVGLLLAAFAFARTVGARAWSSCRESRAALVPGLLAALYLMLLTLSFDNYMPGFLANPPGRFVAEYGLGLGALFGVLLGGREGGRVGSA